MWTMMINRSWFYNDRGWCHIINWHIMRRGYISHRLLIINWRNGVIVLMMAAMLVTTVINSDRCMHDWGYRLINYSCNWSWGSISDLVVRSTYHHLWCVLVTNMA